MRLLIPLVIYFLFILITRRLNYLTVKYLKDDKIVIAWFIPAMNIIASLMMLIMLIGYWYKSSNKSRLTKWFFGENWTPTIINPDDEAKLDRINVKVIEQYLRKKKLKKLK